MFVKCYLHGELGHLFGTEPKGPFLVDTPYEAIQALAANLHGFRVKLLTDRGSRYQLLADGQGLTRDDLEVGRSFQELHILPVIEGAGDTPTEQILIGAALVALTGGLGAAFPVFFAAGTGAASALGVVSGMGWSLAITGVASALYRPKTPDAAKDKKDETSKILSGSYTNAVGMPIPILYGGPLNVQPVNVALSIRNIDDPLGTLGTGDTNNGFTMLSARRIEMPYSGASLPQGTVLFRLEGLDPSKRDVANWEVLEYPDAPVVAESLGSNVIVTSEALSEATHPDPIRFTVRAYSVDPAQGTANFEHVFTVYEQDSNVPAPPTLTGAGGQSSSASVPVQTKADLLSNATAYWMDIISEGPIQGLYADEDTDPAVLQTELRKSVTLSGTPLRTAEGKENFSNIDIKQTYGTKTQAPVDVDWPLLNTPHADGREILHATPLTLTITDPDTDEVVLTFSIPQLFQVAADGGYTSAQVSLTIDVLSGSTVIYSVNTVFNGTAVSQYLRDVKIPRKVDSGTWSIRITRTTEDTTEKYLADTYLLAWSEVVKAKLSFPYTAAVAGSADARNFSDLPERRYVAMGRIIQVPTNYDPLTNKYNMLNGVAQPWEVAWDGTFKEAWSNNPAWCLYDLLVNKRYGCGQWMDVQEVDPEDLLVSPRLLPNKWVFYSIGQECDRMVKSGRKDEIGLWIYEPQFTMNAHIRDQQDAYSLIQTMATCFASMTYYAAGQVWLTQDALYEPVKILNTTNVEGGMFHYSTGEWQTTCNTVRVKWMDAMTGEDRYEVVSDRDAISIAGRVRTKEVEAFGCTSQGQARRFGLRILYTELLEGSFCTCKMGMEATELFVGDIVIVEDPTRRAGAQFAGRVKSDSTASHVVVDRRVGLEDSAQGWTMWCELDGGILVGRPIANSLPYYSNEFTVDPPFPVSPFGSTNFAITKNATGPAKFRILGIKEIARDSFDISLISVNDLKYTKLAEEYLFADSPQNPRPMPGGAVEGLTLAMDTSRVAKGGFPVLTARWNKKDGASVYIVDVDFGSATPVSVNCTSTELTYPLTQLPNLELGSEHVIRVKVFAKVGNTVSPPKSAAIKFMEKKTEDYFTPDERSGAPGGISGIKGWVNMTLFKASNASQVYYNLGAPVELASAEAVLEDALAYANNVLGDVAGYVYTVAGTEYPLDGWELDWPAPPPGINPLGQYFYLGPGGRARFVSVIEALETAVQQLESATQLYLHQMPS